MRCEWNVCRMCVKCVWNVVGMSEEMCVKCVWNV